jgi:hypothetical protein
MEGRLAQELAEPLMPVDDFDDFGDATTIVCLIEWYFQPADHEISTYA